MAFYSDVHTTKKFRLGTVKVDPVTLNEYVYLKGVGSTAVGSWVSFDELFATALIDSDTAGTLVGPVAIAAAAVSATTKYGWYLVKGVGTGKAGTVAADKAVFATTGAGVVDDAVVVGNQIIGAYTRSADSGGFATFQVYNPVIGVADTLS